ncbi:Crp/Fnr family transcriptional regulator [Limnohabitans sp. Rim8]|uniref:Crp/Fnr family transcriptional regulator n=1 Tax=Limnohabitans sp. Rim8 TaxID=1100718 RepID=UPI0026194818|nr:Crp/Fnr family transcriptional regulator [Limnohabitans sp. Rim8]
MTLNQLHSSDRIAAELLQSRQLGRKFVNALAQPMALKSRPLHRFEAGVSLFKAGDRVAQLPFVMSGRLDAVVHVPGVQGGQIVPISFRAGEMAFLSYMFNQLPSGSDLVVGEPSTIQWLPLKDIEACLLNDQGLLLMLVRFLGQRLREVQARERSWAARGVQTRLCAGLARMAADLPSRSDGRAVVVATHDQIAASCGISRPKASIALKALEGDGVLKLGRGWIEVLNLRGLMDGVG